MKKESRGKGLRAKKEIQWAQGEGDVTVKKGAAISPRCVGKNKGRARGKNLQGQTRVCERRPWLWMEKIRSDLVQARSRGDRKQPWN